MTLGNKAAAETGFLRMGMNVANASTDKPDDWVLATGETYTVEELASKAFEIVDLDYKNI